MNTAWISDMQNLMVYTITAYELVFVLWIIHYVWKFTHKD